MNQQEALISIKKALNSTEAEYDEDDLDLNTNLIEEGILDSLDAMSFLFELEAVIDKKINEIDEEFEDFTISKFVEILENY